MHYCTTDILLQDIIYIFQQRGFLETFNLLFILTIFNQEFFRVFLFACYRQNSLGNADFQPILCWCSETRPYVAMNAIHAPENLWKYLKEIMCVFGTRDYYTQQPMTVWRGDSWSGKNWKTCLQHNLSQTFPPYTGFLISQLFFVKNYLLVHARHRRLLL